MLGEGWLNVSRVRCRGTDGPGVDAGQGSGGGMPFVIRQEQKRGERVAAVLNYANVHLLERLTRLIPIFVAPHEGHLQFIISGIPRGI